MNPKPCLLLRYREVRGQNAWNSNDRRRSTLLCILLAGIPPGSCPAEEMMLAAWLGKTPGERRTDSGFEIRTSRLRSPVGCDLAQQTRLGRRSVSLRCACWLGRKSLRAAYLASSLRGSGKSIISPGDSWSRFKLLNARLAAAVLNTLCQ